MPLIVTSNELGSPGLPWGHFQSFYDPPEIHRVVEGEYFYWWKEWRPAHISVEFEMATEKLAQAMWLEKRPWWVSF